MAAGGATSAPMPKPPSEMAAADAPPTETPEPTTLKFKEPPKKMIGQGFERRELKRLTPEEKAKRRMQYNLALGGICLTILAIVVWILLKMSG